MKIGILTFVHALNYGAVLQAYASQKFISNMGIDVSFINHFPVERITKSNNFSKSQLLLNKISNLMHPIKKYQGKKKRQKLSDFKNEFLNISEQIYHGDITELKENYDVVIAGSDQIWNTDVNPSPRPYFLDFKTNAKKAGYALSTGREKLTELDCEMIHKYVNNFEMLSVRENSLKNYLSENENVNCQLVCDPVFLLKENEWSKVAVTPKEKKYVLVYSMEWNDALINAIKNIKHHTNKKVYCINGGGISSASIADKTLGGLGPKEFIGYIKNADIVLTNSFHGAAFSAIFKKKLVVLEHSRRNERLCQLLELCGYPDHFLKLNDENYNLDNYYIDTITAYKNMSEFIEQSREYMKSLCQEN
ncbi:MAG: polysaccharide pyruvyl transferase family protein [Eubacterium sp.]|nr:polysaccharide pyruvyl transferase family protein [Eubacterium sp.]